MTEQEHSPEIFWVSDTHFYHGNIINYCKRPFTIPGKFNDRGIPEPDIELMNSTMLNNWNAKIKPHDIVYFLGDFAFSAKPKVKELLEQLNGNIHLIKGNHDAPLNGLHNYFTSVHDMLTISVPDSDAAGGIQFIQMCHYPLLSWDKMYYHSWHLHGHTHGNLKFDSKFRRVDVGVDNWNFSPVSYSEIKQFLKKNFVGNENDKTLRIS
jgi:calcineurin-like phosphoesterase family protein